MSNNDTLQCGELIFCENYFTLGTNFCGGSRDKQMDILIFSVLV